MKHTVITYQISGSQERRTVTLSGHWSEKAVRNYITRHNGLIEGAFFTHYSPRVHHGPHRNPRTFLTI